MAVTSNLLIEQGATFNVVINYNDDSGNPNDLAGFTAVSQMRRSYYSNSYISFTSNITDATLGEITLGLAANVSANVKVGRYVYDLNIANATHTYRVIEGIVTVLPGVTR